MNRELVIAMWRKRFAGVTRDAAAQQIAHEASRYQCVESWRRALAIGQPPDRVEAGSFLEDLFWLLFSIHGKAPSWQTLRKVLSRVEPAQAAAISDQSAAAASIASTASTSASS